MEKKINIGKAVTGVVVFTLIAKLMGFFREILLSYFFGATGISDAYLISQTIPGTIFQFVGTGLTTCFIPVYYKIFSKYGKDRTDIFVNQIISIVFSFSTIVIILIWVDTPLFVKLFASGFKGKTLFYAIWFTRIGILSLYFSSLIYVYNSYLQANKIFITTAFATIPNSLFIMISIVAGSKINIWLLSIGSTLAVAVQLLFIVPSVVKLKFRFHLNFKWDDEYIKHFFALMVPVIVGVSVNEINTLIDRTVASQVAVGGISVLTYANSLIMFIHGGLVQPIATVCYPKITEAATLKKTNEAKNILENAVLLVLSLLIPITVGFVMYSQQITKLLFGRGAFNKTATQMTSTALIFYAIGLSFIGLRELFSRYFYAYEKTKIPMINASVGVAVNIILNILFSKYFGIGGLACATSVSALVTTALLWLNMWKHLPGGTIKLNKKEVVKIVFATIIMAVTSYGVFNILQFGDIMRLFIGIFAGMIVYAIMAFVLKIKIVNFFMIYLKRFLKK